MLEKYHIDELYLASIIVIRADTNSDILSIGPSSYDYLTILKKVSEDKFIDLQNPRYLISRVRNSKMISYIINYIEPFGNYYTQDGRKRTMFSKRRAIRASQNYLGAFYLNNQ